MVPLFLKERYPNSISCRYFLCIDMSSLERKYNFSLPLPPHILSSQPKTGETGKANHSQGGLCATSEVTSQAQPEQGQKGPVRSMWNTALLLGLAPSNLKIPFLVMEELDVSFSL